MVARRTDDDDEAALMMIGPDHHRSVASAIIRLGTQLDQVIGMNQRMEETISSRLAALEATLSRLEATLSRLEAHTQESNDLLRNALRALQLQSRSIAAAAAAAATAAASRAAERQQQQQQPPPADLVEQQQQTVVVVAQSHHDDVAPPPPPAAVHTTTTKKIMPDSLKRYTLYDAVTQWYIYGWYNTKRRTKTRHTYSITKFCIEYLALFQDHHVPKAPEGRSCHNHDEDEEDHEDNAVIKAWREDVRKIVQTAIERAESWAESHITTTGKNISRTCTGFQHAMYRSNPETWPPTYPEGPFQHGTKMRDKAALIEHIANSRKNTAIHHESDESAAAGDGNGREEGDKIKQP